MFLVDTSVWINLFRDQTGNIQQQFAALVGEQPYYLSRFSQVELLQGSRNEQEWQLLNTYLEDQDYLDLQSHHWYQAARIYYDLRRQGKTVRSTIDCCIAQLALSYDLILIHQDRDFEVINGVRPLKLRYL